MVMVMMLAVVVVVMFSSVQFSPLTDLDVGGWGWRDTRNESAEIIFQPFLREAKSGVGRDILCPLFDVVHPTFPLLTTASPTLQGALKDDFREAVVACDMPKPCKVPSLDLLPEEVPVDPQGN